MGGLSARTSGAAVVGGGLVLSALHVRTGVLLWGRPILAVMESFVPLLLSLSIATLGTLMWRGELVPERFAGRTLAWSVVGIAALAVAVGWLSADAALRAGALPPASRTLLGAVTLGGLGGLVVGVYDARGRWRRSRMAQLTRINDTLRIATQEMVHAADREELEAEVCDRLTRSDLYDSAWIGRYTPGTTEVRPVAWAGHDEEYIESLEVTVDPTDPVGQGPGGEAIRTGEIQPVQDVFAEPTLEPWWDLLASRGVESMAVVPLVGGDRVYGFLSVYADRTNAFDAAEREALSELGESIGHALDSMTARDQLARRERELARQNERLDEFASVVSHDLRNPLNVARGNLELARETPDREYLERIAGALDRMDDLIDDVLTLARDGRTVSEFRPVDLRSVADAAWATTTTADATLVFADDPGTVQGDEGRLVRVFENLFRNAIEHGSTGSPAGTRGGSVAHDAGDEPPTAEAFTRGTSADERDGDERASDEPDDDADGGLTVTVGRTESGFYVADDGPGIPESERETVFETGYSTATDGTGFGLNIVRSIAEAHGWEVTVTESAAGGARFEFNGIPAAEDERVERPPGDGSAADDAD
ncbi:sensor histidine kinase [Haloplanus halophilus]|uniref:receiver/sensor box histidine kinase n=1 Tax=Haloplanus halophilus TaxID=2949993 RepID=UPI002040DA9D|nr:HAMP domain-containing sensor histidine kinase [Haloplanus sp. GDY1]